MVSAESLATALNGRRSGAGWVARCPVPGHVDKHPSLRISERYGKVLVKCWGGCDQGDVIDELRRRGLWGGPPNGWHYAGGAYASSDKPKDPMKPWRSAAPFVRGSAVD